MYIPTPTYLHCLTAFSPIPSQNSWTVFQISYAVGMQVTSVLQMKDFTLDGGGDYQRSGNMLEPLGILCLTYGSGPFPTGYPIHYQSPPPHRLCRVSPYRLLQSRKTDSSWKHLWWNHSLWPGNRIVHKYQSHKNSPADAQWLSKGWSSHHQATPRGGGGWCPGVPCSTWVVSGGTQAQLCCWRPHHDSILLLPATHWWVHH